jgi:hypothetical protein
VTPDPRFFQAAATVIPTLFIAIVFSAKLFDPLTTNEDEDRKAHGIAAIFGFVIVSTFLPAIVGGERAALAALFSNDRLEERANGVIIGLVAELFLIASFVYIRAVARPAHIYLVLRFPNVFTGHVGNLLAFAVALIPILAIVPFFFIPV